jgi:hypothetical protein
MGGYTSRAKRISWRLSRIGFKLKQIGYGSGYIYMVFDPRNLYNPLAGPTGLDEIERRLPDWEARFILVHAPRPQETRHPQAAGNGSASVAGLR